MMAFNISIPSSNVEILPQLHATNGRSTNNRLLDFRIKSIVESLLVFYDVDLLYF